VFVLFDKFDDPAAITANVKHREPDDREFTSARPRRRRENRRLKTLPVTKGSQVVTQ
jgi:hypothetical protein